MDKSNQVYEKVEIEIGQDNATTLVITLSKLPLSQKPSSSSSSHSRNRSSLGGSSTLLTLGGCLLLWHIHRLGYGIHYYEAKWDQVHPLKYRCKHKKKLAQIESDEI